MKVLSSGCPDKVTLQADSTVITGTSEALSVHNSQILLAPDSLAPTWAKAGKQKRRKPAETETDVGTGSENRNRSCPVFGTIVLSHMKADCDDSWVV